MTTPLTVWDCKTPPPIGIGQVLCWQGYANTDQVFSVPRYLEDNAEHFRAKYLAFIHDLGESQINGKSLIDHLDTGDGYSFWWMSRLAEKNPLISPNIYNCLRMLALEKIILDKKPSKLAFYSSDLNLGQAIKQLCQNLGITFVWQSDNKVTKNLSLRKLYLKLPFLLQGLISLRHIGLRWPLRKLEKPQWFSGIKSIFLCSYFIHLDPAACSAGQFYSRQWGSLTKYFNESGRLTNWVHHFLFSPVVPNVQTGLRWLKLFNLAPKKQGYHIFLETYLSWNVLFRALKNWCWLTIVSWRLRRIHTAFYPQHSFVWLWPILQDDWFNSLKGPVAIHNCLWVELFDTAMKDIPSQKKGLYLYEHQGWECAFLRAWRRNGHGEIIGVPHATVPFWHLYYFHDPRSITARKKCSMPLPDRLAVNGKFAKKAFSDTGFPVEKLVEVEALRYLNLSHTPKKSCSEPSNLDVPKVSILILGDMLPSAMHNLLKLIENTVKLLPSNYQFTFKPHPGYVVALADYPGLQANETSDPLDQILEQYDIVFSANSTSASVDAYITGLPVIIALDKGQLNLSPLRGHPGVHFVATSEELASVLYEISQNLSTHQNRSDFFFIDHKLPRWQSLLSSGMPS
jgi:surface carbohydrate biosynthesis protein (TIGR04326 family)